MARVPPAIIGLLAANGVFFALTFWLPDLNLPMYREFALFFPQNDLFRPWQLVTSLFMHGGFAHLAFNMMALVMFGAVLERIWGTGRFLIFYFVVGIGAGVIYTAVNWIQFASTYQQAIEAGIPPEVIQASLERWSRTGNDQLDRLRDLYARPAVGASGAIYGVLVAFGLYFPNARLSFIFLPVPIAAKYFIPGLVALDLLSGVTGFSLFGGGIAHFAHIGGALIGLLLMWYWRKHLPDRRTGARPPSAPSGAA